MPDVGPYIYDVSISGFTRSSIYIYDISSLRVKFPCSNTGYVDGVDRLTTDMLTGYAETGYADMPDMLKDGVS